MATNRFIKLTVKLSSNNDVTLYLGAQNFALQQEKDGVRLIDCTHNNGGWKLHSSISLEEVTSRIDDAMYRADMLKVPKGLGVKD